MEFSQYRLVKEIDVPAQRISEIIVGLKDGIARALSLRVWHRNELQDMRRQIQKILSLLDRVN